MFLNVILCHCLPPLPQQKIKSCHYLAPILGLRSIKSIDAFPVFSQWYDEQFNANPLNDYGSAGSFYQLVISFGLHFFCIIISINFCILSLQTLQLPSQFCLICVRYHFSLQGLELLKLRYKSK